MNVAKPSEEPRLGDNKMAHYEMMKKDMQRLIEFKNELELLVEQQNQELDNKNTSLALLQKEIKTKDQQIEQMEDYISQLEKRIKSDEYKMMKKEASYRKSKQGQSAEMSKKIREQENEIKLLKDMINGGKKELKAKVTSIHTLKQRVNSLEKINKLHLSRHSEVGSIVSKDFRDKRDSKYY